MPILLLAGGLDRITPPSFAEKLASLNETFASLKIFEGAHHDDMFAHGAWDALAGFLVQFQLPELIGSAAEAAPLDTVQP